MLNTLHFPVTVHPAGQVTHTRGEVFTHVAAFKARWHRLWLRDGAWEEWATGDGTIRAQTPQGKVHCQLRATNDFGGRKGLDARSC